MNNGYMEYIDILFQKLKFNEFNSVEFDRYSESDFPILFDTLLELRLEECNFGVGVWNRNEFDIHGDEHPVRTLGLLLISRAVSAPVQAMLLRLDTESGVNFIYLDPIKAELNFYDCVPKVLEYKFCAETDDYSRECMIVKNIDRPSFGYLAKDDKAERLNREIPEWARSGLIIGGTANSALRLGSMLLDLTHPTRPGGGLMQLQRRFEQVCALTYSIDFKLTLTDCSLNLMTSRDI